MTDLVVQNFFMLPAMHFTLSSSCFKVHCHRFRFQVCSAVTFFSLRSFPIFHNFFSIYIPQRVPNSWRITVQTIAMHLFGRISHGRAWLFRICTFTEGPVGISWLPLPQAKRIDPSRWIRRIRIQIQPTRIADRVFTDKLPNPGIIVPIAVVVQPRFVIVVLALKSDRVG